MWGSKTELPLAKADSTSSADGTFPITYLRKGKKHCVIAVQENGKKKKNQHARNSPAETQISEEGEEVL